MRDSTTTRPSLLARLREPEDGRAWVEFLEIYTPLVRRLARQCGLQDADADDLAQDVFRAVASKIDRWEPGPDRGSFRAWLFKVARNLILNLAADRRRHPRGSGDTDVARLLDERPAPDDGATALFDAERRRQLFRWAADKVRPEFREPTWQAFWRTAVDGQKSKDVADALGITAGAVYVYRNRVLARIRRTIERVETP